MTAHRGWTAQDDEDLSHLVDRGFEIESVAWALSRSPETVRARLAEIRRGALGVGIAAERLEGDEPGSGVDRGDEAAP